MEKLEINIFIVAGVALIASLVLFIIYFVVLYRKNQLKHLIQQEKLKNEFQKGLLESQLEIREQTLKNVSQEIHDNIGQTLSLAKLNLNTLDLQKQNAQDKILSSKELVSKAIHDLRNLSRSLNTDSILSSGLIKAIETELSIVDHSGDLKTQFETKGQTLRIDSKKELILFRIVQEAINNIIKHSGAGLIKVNLDFTNEHLVIEVNDNGKGFESNSGNGEGIGLRNMKSRAELIGGNFNIQSNSGGTTITVTLPISES
jgi:signal transduction histidine kinase